METELSSKEHRENATLALEMARVRDLIAENPVTEKDRFDYIEKLVYNERRFNERQMFSLAGLVAGRLRQIKKTTTVAGIKCAKSNVDVVQALLNEPELASMSYGALAQKFNRTPANMVRLVRLSGIKKINAKSAVKEAAKKVFMEQPVPLRAHGLSRMTAYRYAKEAGLIPDRTEKVTVLDEAKVPAKVPISLKVPYANKCHQRLIREATQQDDLNRLASVLGSMEGLSASQFLLAVEPYSPCHRAFIKRYEWLGTPGVGIKWCFTARFKNELGGVVLMSEPYYSDHETALIARGACAGWTPKNLGSRLVMFGCRWMAANTHKRQFIGYADEEANEVGQIYQACNFKFLGWKPSVYGVDADGNRKSFQTLKRTSRMVPWLAKQGITLPQECFTDKGFLRWAVVPEETKRRMREHIQRGKLALRKVKVNRGKYVLVLGRSSGETRRLNREFVEIVYAYPKRPAESAQRLVGNLLA